VTVPDKESLIASDDLASVEFERHRRHLMGLAYRLLGSIAEAEDAVQDAWLRWHAADREAVENPRAFLSTTVTRLSLDRLKSAQRRRETYVGAWLPEPLVEDAFYVDLPAEPMGDDVSMALMLMLERLSPLERAAFILHDVFDMGFDEIAKALGRSEAACRQLASRARTRVHQAKPRFHVDAGEGARVAEAFFAAIRSGNTVALRDLLADGAVLQSDGGGLKLAALNPIVGADRVFRFFDGLAHKGRGVAPLWHKELAINGLPGSVTLENDSVLQTTALEIVDGKIVTIYVVRNPEKLNHLRRMVPFALPA
jgi:RNA polymerase sigma-70 factor, ECF subfamily